MAKFRLDFNLQAWIQGVEIDADSMEEAEDKLYRMTIDELLEEGYIHTSDLSDVDIEVVEQDYKVRVYNIVFDPEDILEYGLDRDLPDEDTVLEFEFKDVRVEKEYEELEMYISDTIFDTYGLDPDRFDFDIL